MPCSAEHAEKVDSLLTAKDHDSNMLVKAKPQIEGKANEYETFDALNGFA